MKWLVLLTVALAVWLLLWIVSPGVSARPCTHGVSSVGPMTITGGRVAGDTVPRTEGCLP